MINFKSYEEHYEDALFAEKFLSTSVSWMFLSSSEEELTKHYDNACCALNKIFESCTNMILSGE